jgi:hypothetical protein
LTAAERQAAAAAARRASKGESQPWRIGDVHGGGARGRRPRLRRANRGRRGLVGVLAFAAIALVVYAAFFGSTPSGHSSLRLPNLGRAFETGR